MPIKLLSNPLVISATKVMKRTAALSIAVAMLASAAVQAATVVGGSTLLTAGYANQLETWLGEGPITLTNIFTKQAGDDAFDFHAAADGRGRTFVVMYGTEGNTGNSAIYGGYNPQSWNSTNTYNITNNIADRTGFLFNLTNDQLFRQRTTAFTGGPWSGVDGGMYQTYNAAGYGPTFGGAWDQYVAGSLNVGYSYLWSYSDDDAPTGGVSIIDGSAYTGYDVRIAGIEIFSISDAAVLPVPEPGTLALFAIAVTGLVTVRRRNN